jgi:hypothetical protein
MTDGRFEYRVRVLAGDEEVAAGAQAIYVVGEPPAAAEGADGT